MTMPRVFASYAQRDYNKQLRKFVEDLATELDSQTVGDAATVVFFDRKGVHAGEKWSDVIIDAVSETGVLVCLMTPRYFTRPWCGRELQTFLDRTSALPPHVKPRFIFPIWWQRPAGQRTIPKRLLEYLNTDDGYPAEYATTGVRELALEGKRIKLGKLVRRLAALITQALETAPQLPRATPVPDVEDIMNAFDEQQPYDVRVVSLTQGGDAWRPTTGEPTIAEALDTTAENLTVFIRKADTGPNLAASLRKAQDEQQVILLIADAVAPPDQTVRDINAMKELTNLSILLMDVGTPSVGAETWLGRFDPGAFAAAQAEGRFGLATSGNLSKEMEKTVYRSRSLVIGRAKTAPVRDDRLVEQAREQGISVAAQPNLSGPATG